MLNSVLNVTILTCKHVENTDRTHTLITGVCVYIYVCVCMCVYVCMYVCICIHIHDPSQGNMYVNTYT